MEKVYLKKNCEGMFLKKEKDYELIELVNELLDTRLDHQRIKEFGDRSKIVTIIRKEAIKLTQFLRGEKGKHELSLFKPPLVDQKMKEDS